MTPHIHKLVGWLGGLGLVTALGASESRADRIVMRGGGEVQGVVLKADPDRPDMVLVLTAGTVRPFEFKKEQVVSVEVVNDALRAYVERSEKVVESAEGEYELALWCEEHELSGPAKRHFQRAIERDPSFAPARKKLGHVLHNGKWMTYDEQRAAQGLVKYQGRWVSPQEKTVLDEKASFTSEQESWFRRLKVLRQKIYGNDPEIRQQAEGQLAEIREPAAVAPLMKVFGADDEPMRIRLAQLIAGVSGPEARDALIRLLLTEPVPAVREATLHELDTLHDADTPGRLMRALTSKDPIVVGRAAWALGMIGAVQAVPKLIPVLVKVEEKWIYDPTVPRQPGMSVGLVEGGPGAAIPAGAGGFAVPGASGTVAPGYIAGGVSYPVLTGPVVGNGVVAYGATSIPFGTFTGLNLGGTNPNRPVIRRMTNIYNNEDVLAALERLTGVNFGYDVRAWKRWQRVSFRPSTTPERRVPQP